MITIVDYGMGNLGSIANMIKKIGGMSIITADPDEIEIAEKLILPGVGAFDEGMANLEKRGLLKILNYKVLDKKTPVLGICLGMQLLSKSSEEGKRPGLGWIDALTIRFEFNGFHEKYRIPHMGWNTIQPQKDCRLFTSFSSEPRFYFVHSYHVVCKNSKNILATTEYGFNFTSAVQHDNILGVQFHPEKSHKFGMNLLKNFIEL